MSLCGCSLNGIADVFPQTGQITSVELLWFFICQYNLFDVPGIAEIRASMVYFEQIDAMLQKRDSRTEVFFATVFSKCFPACLYISFREKK